jgi:hypothetical protein
VKLLPAMTEGDRAAVNGINGWHPSRWVETLKSAGDSVSHPYTAAADWPEGLRADAYMQQQARAPG